MHRRGLFLMRSDLIDRYSAGLGEDGLTRLLENSVHNSNGHHRHANDEMIVGHTTLSSGSVPGIQGMAINL